MPFKVLCPLHQAVTAVTERTISFYLQVFRQKTIHINGHILQQIIHWQEVSPYDFTIADRINHPVSNRKVFCVDDEAYSTMLFAEKFESIEKRYEV